MAMQQILEMLGINIFFLFHPVSVCWHVCGCIGVNRERIISLTERNLQGRKSDGRMDKNLLWVLSSHSKGKNIPFILSFFFLDMTFPFHSSLLHFNGSGYLTQQFCSRLLAAPRVASVCCHLPLQPRLCPCSPTVLSGKSWVAPAWFPGR